MADTTLTELQHLRIEETSAVDAPANLLPGFMVCKARTDAALAKALDAAIECIASEIPADFKVERANPNQRRGDDGRYRRHVPGPTDLKNPAAVEPPPVPAADDLPAEKTTGFFRPARNVYSRIF